MDVGSHHALAAHCPMSTEIIYKICDKQAWAEAERVAAFRGAEIDRQDGFIHLSAAHQVRETAEKHFSGQPDLVLVSVRTDSLGDDLKWERSRGGDFFPHLYADLRLDAVTAVDSLPLAEDGLHRFPDGIPQAKQTP